MKDRVRLRLEIRGRVQGVWFRGSAQKEALRLAIDGWARNRADGSVEILAEGLPASMGAFVEWCHSGPSGARVSRVDRHPEATGDDLNGFSVRY